MTPAEIHAYQHPLILGRIRALLDADLKGRKLAIARELLAFTIVGHDRLWPDCPLTWPYN